MTGTHRISQSTFMLVANGAEDSPPGSAVRDFLIAHEARRVITVWHPLEAEHGRQHAVTVYEPGVRPRRRSLQLPSWPPFTYAFDPLVPAWPQPVDCWVGFNNLAVARGLVQRRLGRASTVVYWAVDFVPNRFRNGALTRLYEALDALCCRRADARFEVSEVALAARNALHGVDEGAAASTHIAPMGAWLARVPVTPPDGWKARRVIFLGHLVPRQGLGCLVEALVVLRERGIDFTAEIAGHGPLEQDLRSAIDVAGLHQRVKLIGFLSDHRQVEAFLASGSVGVAPYDTTVESFTRFADPSKIRAYTAAGLPIVTTDVPPNASELAERAGAEIVPFDAAELADAIERALASPEGWAQRRSAALAYARSFDWEKIIATALETVGFAD